MNSYSFSVYKITINRHLRKDEKVNLSDFDNGKNFLQLVDSMFISWKDNLNRKVVKDEDVKIPNTVFRFLNDDEREKVEQGKLK